MAEYVGCQREKAPLPERERSCRRPESLLLLRFMLARTAAGFHAHALLLLRFCSLLAMLLCPEHRHRYCAVVGGGVTEMSGGG